MTLVVVTDAWHPQVNGVVRTLTHVTDQLRAMGQDVALITPDQFTTVPCPMYPEIRLAVWPIGAVSKKLKSFGTAAKIHIATEGPLGIMARNYCLRNKIRFTTSFHTLYPEYIHARTGLPISLGYKVLRRFHAPSAAVMVPTPAVQDILKGYRFPNTVLWTRGVDTELFRPREETLPYPKPILLSVGRLAVEKNLPAFLSLDVKGTKVVVGDGPARKQLERDFPSAIFLGKKEGEELAKIFAASDAFVFPSRTDTFGLVLLEALSSGLPVAAYPVQGPKDVITDPKTGVLHEDLATAIEGALLLSRHDCRAFAEQFSWEACALQFLSHVEKGHGRDDRKRSQKFRTKLAKVAP